MNKILRAAALTFGLAAGGNAYAADNVVIVEITPDNVVENFAHYYMCASLPYDLTDDNKLKQYCAARDELSTALSTKNDECDYNYEVAKAENELKVIKERLDSTVKSELNAEAYKTREACTTANRQEFDDQIPGLFRDKLGSKVLMSIIAYE